MGGNIFFRVVSKNLSAFFPPKKCSFILQTFLTTFFFSDRPFPRFIMYFFVGGPNPHKFTVAVIILSANFEGGHGRIGPPWIRTSSGAEGGPFEPLDFLQVGGPFREVGGPRPTLALR